MTFEKPKRQPKRQYNDRSCENRFEELIEPARLGDRNAIGELISEYRNYLLLIANEGLDQNIKAKLGPSDVVQQTMMAAQDNLGQFRGESEREFRAWIRQILKHDLQDANRKYNTTKRRQVHLENRLDDSRLKTPEPVDGFATPRTDALVNERAELLNASMRQLSEPYQRILQLRNWQELSFAEIGDQLDCSADAARKLWYRAVVKLQDTLYRISPEMKSSLIDPPPNQLESGNNDP